MILLLFLLAINLFKLIIAPYFPLIGDEAYYWLWSQHLDLSYVDHPPMIAYFNFLLTTLFGQNELAIRLGAISLVLLISIIIYLTGKELYGEKAGLLATIIFNLIPTFFAGGLFLVPQMLLFFFWSLSFYLVVKLIKTNQGHYWYWLGLSTGGGLLSDYIMALFFITTVIYCYFNRNLRFWFTKKEPFLATFLALVIFSPVIIWNFRLGFTPLFYWGGKMGVTTRLADNLLNFFGLQMLLYTPPIFIGTFNLIFRRWKPETKSLGFQKIGNREVYSQVPWLLKLYAGAVFLPFLLISPIMNVGGHWPSAAYLPAILDSHRAKKLTIGLILFFAILVNIIGISYYLFFYPVPNSLRGQEFIINAKLPSYIKATSPKGGRTFIFANDLGILGLVSFHGRTKAFMAQGRLRQVDLWGTPKLQKGDNIIYFAINETPLYEKLTPLFKRVWLEPQVRLFNKDANLPNKTQIFHCEGFEGGKLP